jgi:cytochrome c biogenesis protein
MLPVDMGDGAPVFLLGVRDTPAESFRYLRVPADDQGEHGRLPAPARGAGRTRPCASRRCAATPRRRSIRRGPSWPSSWPSAGAGPGAVRGRRAGPGQAAGGLQAMSDFMETNVPEAERERAGEVLVRILNGTAVRADADVARTAGLKPPEPGTRRPRPS